MAASIPFGKPCIDDADRAAVAEALTSDWILNGPKVRAFEARLAEYWGGRATCAVHSCTAGMHAVLAALGLGPGDEVVMPALSFAANGAAVLAAGARPVFADVDPVTWNLNPDGLEKAFTPRTKAVLLLHYAGLPADMDRILGVAEAHGVTVVEDAAHALGSRLDGREIGSFGHASVFSFGPLKMITSAGMGGMVSTNDSELIIRVRRFLSYGMDKSMWDRREDQKPWQYGVAEFGHNFRMTDAAAAMGLTQMDKLEHFVSRRRKLAALYAKGLGGLDGVEPQPEPEGSLHSRLYYVVRVDSGRQGPGRDELAAALLENGVGVSVHWDPPLHRHLLYRPYAPAEGSLPVTDRLSLELLSLPMYPSLSDADVERITGILKGVRK